MILQIVHLKKFSAKNKRYPDKRAFSWLIYEEVFVIMIEIQGENEKGLKVFINGIPDIKEMHTKITPAIYRYLIRLLFKQYPDKFFI